MDLLAQLFASGGTPGPTKRCTLCKVEYAATTDNFHRHPVSPDGLKPRCKGCQCRAEADRYARMGPERRAAYKANIKAWNMANGSRRYLITERYRKANPAKMRARDAVQRALRRGQITRHDCEACGSGGAQAHHDDYSRPLDVRWLCPAHHAKADADRRLRETA